MPHKPNEEFEFHRTIQLGFNTLTGLRDGSRDGERPGVASEPARRLFDRIVQRRVYARTQAGILGTEFIRVGAGALPKCAAS